MNIYQIKKFFLLWIFLLGSVSNIKAQTPAPQIEQLFQLTISDGTQAQAVFLPTLDGQLHLVYATSSGKIGLYLISPKLSPGPVPPIPIPPIPPMPPVPPTPQPTQKLIIGIVEDPAATTFEQKTVLVNKEWRELATTKHTFIGLIPQNITEGDTNSPPASLVPFLDRAKGKNLPWVVLFDMRSKLLWEGSLPKTPSEMTAIIKKFGG
jgi:hypothetical protein